MQHSIDRNEYDVTGENLHCGEAAQERFEQIARRRGYTVTKSDARADMDEHTNYLTQSNKESLKVEVQAMKNVSRCDAAAQDKWVWVETKGVRPCDPGWLYGKADVIASETEESSLIVDRQELVQFVEQNTDAPSRVFKPEDAMKKTADGKYTVHCRRNQSKPDKMILLETDRLRRLSKTGEWFFQESMEGV